METAISIVQAPFQKVPEKQKSQTASRFLKFPEIFLKKAGNTISWRFDQNLLCLLFFLVYFAVLFCEKCFEKGAYFKHKNKYLIVRRIH